VNSNLYDDILQKGEASNNITRTFDQLQYRNFEDIKRESSDTRTVFHLHEVAQCIEFVCFLRRIIVNDPEWHTTLKVSGAYGRRDESGRRAGGRRRKEGRNININNTTTRINRNYNCCTIATDSSVVTTPPSSSSLSSSSSQNDSISRVVTTLLENMNLIDSRRSIEDNDALEIESKVIEGAMMSNSKEILDFFIEYFGIERKRNDKSNDDDDDESNSGSSSSDSNSRQNQKKRQKTFESGGNSSIDDDDDDDGGGVDITTATAVGNDYNNREILDDTDTKVGVVEATVAKNINLCRIVENCSVEMLKYMLETVHVEESKIQSALSFALNKHIYLEHSRVLIQHCRIDSKIIKGCRFSYGHAREMYSKMLADKLLC
jgi:hypothetical protein